MKGVKIALMPQKKIGDGAEIQENAVYDLKRTVRINRLEKGTLPHDLLHTIYFRGFDTDKRKQVEDGLNSIYAVLPQTAYEIAIKTIHTAKRSSWTFWT